MVICQWKNVVPNAHEHTVSPTAIIYFPAPSANPAIMELSSIFERRLAESAHQWI
jgi:hypothetical protein